MKITKHKSPHRDIYKDLTRKSTLSIDLTNIYFDVNLTKFPKLIWYMVL